MEINIKDYLKYQEQDKWLTLEEFVYLKLIYDEDYDLASEFRKVIEIACEIRVYGLESRGYIKLMPDNEGLVHSDTKSIELREKTLLMFTTDELTIEDLAKQYRELFPSGVRTGGYPVKSNLKDITSKLKKFKKKYNYSSEKILEATTRYVERMRLQSYSYMKTAEYFIMKDNSSLLASECEGIGEPNQEVSVSTTEML